MFTAQTVANDTERIPSLKPPNCLPEVVADMDPWPLFVLVTSAFMRQFCFGKYCVGACLQ